MIQNRPKDVPLAIHRRRRCVIRHALIPVSLEIARPDLLDVHVAEERIEIETADLFGALPAALGHLWAVCIPIVL